MISSLSMAAAIFGAFGPRFARENRDKFFTTLRSAVALVCRSRLWGWRFCSIV
jgi:hypothetical protein